MRKLFLSILWHQHQPYYKDDCDGRYYMPWVYLHAIKDYYEMARHLECAPADIRATFNYVPSLLIQLEDYTSFEVADNFLILARKNTPELSTEERVTLLNQCFMANIDNMVRPIKRYSELYDRLVAADGDKSIFNNDEVLDIVVLYLLSWTGVYLRCEDELVGGLLKKGRNFKENEKIELLHRLADWVKKVKEIHVRLRNSCKAEITCTPYFHPILPLLTDFASAKEAYPNMSMPEYTENLERDADFHVSEGIKEFERFFGFKPNGMWPAEGSVSQKTIPKYMANDIKFIATDEEVLANSLRVNLKDADKRHRLYMRRFQYEKGKKIFIFFRDKELSDLIGFTYSNWNEDDAVADFISKLRAIYESVCFSPHVSVILDGENAWEYYKNNAFGFFQKLYKALSEQDWLETQTFSEATCNNDVPEEILPNIVAGSWIMGNFKIWIGHPEKNKAWELLSKTKRAIDNNISAIQDNDIKKQIYKELHVAEGSDWFWWFGDDHFSIQADVFDRLFRNHLINIYRALNLNVPSELYIPIKSSQKKALLRAPSAKLTPIINGEFSSFFEWLGAGVYDLKADASSMHAGGEELKELFFAFDDKNIYLAMQSDFSEKKAGDILEIELTSDSSRSIYEVNFANKKLKTKDFSYAFDKILEVAISISDLKEKAGGRFYVSFRLKHGASVIEKAPLYSAVEINVLETFENEWVV